MGKDDKKESVLSFIGPDIEIQGNIHFAKNLRIDGTLVGDILSEGGALVVGKSARVNGDIKVDTATIMGVINGKITARKRVDAFPPAKIKGDIISPIIGLEKGVEFSGNCEITPKHAIK